MKFLTAQMLMETRKAKFREFSKDPQVKATMRRLRRKQNQLQRANHDFLFSVGDALDQFTDRFYGDQKNGRKLILTQLGIAHSYATKLLFIARNLRHVRDSLPVNLTLKELESLARLDNLQLLEELDKLDKKPSRTIDEDDMGLRVWDPNASASRP